MPHSKNSKTRIAAAQRHTEALQLRLAGLTYRQIGERLGYTEQRAHRVVTEELARLNAERAEQAAEVTRLELERLDALLAVVWPKAERGEMGALDRVLAIMNRRARLLGLDAPEKRELTGKDGRPLDVRLEDLSDDELKRIAVSGSTGTAAEASSAPPA
jgi:hypothetical protein